MNLRFKKMVTGMAMSILLVASMVVSASATNVSTQATENFHVYVNGGSVVSSQVAFKTDPYGAMMTKTVKRAGSSVNWLSSEKVNLRGRTPGGTKCTGLGVVNYSGQQKNLYYYSGYGALNTGYRIAVQYDNNNPYTHLELTVTWRP